MRNPASSREKRSKDTARMIFFIGDAGPHQVGLPAKNNLDAEIAGRVREKAEQIGVSY